MENGPGKVGAVVLAAGQSRRMGRPKMTLPWGGATVIGRVVAVLADAGLEEIVVVTGGARAGVEAALAGLPARAAFNPRFAEEDMALSLQVGLRSLSAECMAALVALGDQPQIEAPVVRAILDACSRTAAPLIVPSYRMRRGHPWVIQRSLWPEILALPPGQTLRDVLNAHAADIDYLTVDSPSILSDLDTPEEYDRQRP